MRVLVFVFVLLAGWGATAMGQAGPGPVILEMGPVEPTPPPTPRDAERLRLVSTVTVQNNAEGESVISFEVVDVAEEKNDRIRPIAFKTYSLAEDAIKEAPAAAAPLAREIIAKIRDLERDMLRYAEVAGPPKERKPIIE